MSLQRVTFSPNSFSDLIPELFQIVLERDEKLVEMAHESYNYDTSHIMVTYGCSDQMVLFTI